MTDSPKKVVTRFAPSPTGFMHIGGVRTALFAYLWARKNNGTFILRIEDTDREREVPGSLEHIQECLKWLTLEWDYGPDNPKEFGSCIQSERLHTYREMAQKLLEKGFAYPDPFTFEEVEAWRKQAAAEKRPFLFREHRPHTIEQWDGKRPLRFRVPEIKRYTWHDEVRGELTAGEEALDDFILLKSDGYPTYNFAHIVDDYHMGVTHIFRADEFISSTPRFLSLYEALGIEHPAFVTLPPILREDKTKKLGKRDGAKDMLEYRTEGFLPEAMINFLALIGWNPGTEQEVFTKEEIIAAFDISRVQTHGAVVNEEKLHWLNREHLLLLSNDDVREYVQPAFENLLAVNKNMSLDRLLPLIRERVSTLQDLKTAVAEGEYDYFFTDPVIETAKLAFKDTILADVAKHLSKAIEILNIEGNEIFSDPEGIKKVLWDYATQEGRGAVLWPIRYALTGKEKSPDPFTVASIIGKDVTIRRLEAALVQLQSNVS